jgi:hypothetical protein
LLTAAVSILEMMPCCVQKENLNGDYGSSETALEKQMAGSWGQVVHSLHYRKDTSEHTAASHAAALAEIPSQEAVALLVVQVQSLKHPVQEQTDLEESRHEDGLAWADPKVPALVAATGCSTQEALELVALGASVADYLGVVLSVWRT